MNKLKIDLPNVINSCLLIDQAIDPEDHYHEYIQPNIINLEAEVLIDDSNYTLTIGIEYYYSINKFYIYNDVWTTYTNSIYDGCSCDYEYYSFNERDTNKKQYRKEKKIVNQAIKDLNKLLKKDPNIKLYILDYQKYQIEELKKDIKDKQDYINNLQNALNITKEKLETSEYNLKTFIDKNPSITIL